MLERTSLIEERRNSMLLNACETLTKSRLVVGVGGAYPVIYIRTGSIRVEFVRIYVEHTRTGGLHSQHLEDYTMFTLI